MAIVKTKRIIMLVAFVSLIVTFIASLCIGRYNISVWDVFSSLFSEGNLPSHLILLNLRFPRVICAILIGAALASSGAAYQGIFQNPLVSPDILGVSAGACVGAIISIILGINNFWVMFFAFVTGIISVLLAMSLSFLTKKNKKIVLVFSGIIVGRLMSSIVGMLIFFADDESQLGAIIEWQMGSLSKVSIQNVLIFGPPIIVCTFLLYVLRWRINLLSIGDIEAKALGVDVSREMMFTILVATLATAISICMAGTISWIGLIIPHVCRWIIKDDNRYSMPLNIILGGIVLLVADTTARSLMPYELPLEVITGIVGAPIFAIIMVKRWKE
jgi:iron complex transport system permease protein